MYRRTTNLVKRPQKLAALAGRNQNAKDEAVIGPLRMKPESLRMIPESGKDPDEK